MGKHFILVLASDMRRLGFMSMYERNFVLRWVMSIGAPEDLAKMERFEFALVNFSSDPERAIEFCGRLKKIQPRTRIVFFKSENDSLPADFCADLVLEDDIPESELAARLQEYVKISA